MIIEKSRGEHGFTLIELLVVILIIGVLAAVAVPAFMNQRQRSHDAAVISDLKNFNTAVTTFLSTEGKVPHSVDMLKEVDMNWSWESIGTSDLQGANANNLLYCTKQEDDGSFLGNEWLLYIRSESGKSFITGTPIEGVKEVPTSGSANDHCRQHWDSFFPRWGYFSGASHNPDIHWAQDSYLSWKSN